MDNYIIKQVGSKYYAVAMFEAAGFTIDVLATDTAQSAETEAA